MNDDPCVIQINGTNYYIACDSIDSVSVINNHLVNTSNQSITMFYDYPTQSVSGSGFPRIQASANQYFYYRSSSSATSTLLNVDSMKIINRHTSNDILLMVVLIGVIVINLFKR